LSEPEAAVLRAAIWVVPRVLWFTNSPQRFL